MSPEMLFSQAEIGNVIDRQLARAKDAVAKIRPNDLLNGDDGALAQTVIETYRIHVPLLDLEAKEATHEEIDYDLRKEPRGTYFISDYSRPYPVKGTRVELTVPFNGDAGLFHVRPSTWSLSPPWGTISENCLVLIHEAKTVNPEQIEKGFNSTLGEISASLDNLRQSAESFAKELESLVKTEIQRRKQKLREESEALGRLSMPIRRKGDAPATYRVPIARRPVPVATQVVKSRTTTNDPKPIFPDDEYSHILSIFSNMVSVMEQSPKAFAHMGEEDLRTHFLVQLNAQYQGNATGETFNYSGKTDILLRIKGKNIFVAECKFWSGEKAFLDTLDQLLGYLQWRDNKAAILLFNRNKSFSEVLAKIIETVPKHSNFVSGGDRVGETNFRYRFKQKQDAERNVTLTVMAFDVPAKI